jgi:DNA-directed RNA polymerase specialized sigma subunit
MHTKQFQDYQDYKQLADEYKQEQQWHRKPAPTWNPKDFQDRMSEFKEADKNYNKPKKKVPTMAEIEAALKLEEELWNS